MAFPLRLMERGKDDARWIVRYLLPYCIFLGCLIYLFAPEDPSTRSIDCRVGAMPIVAATQPVNQAEKRAATTRPCGEISQARLGRGRFPEGKERSRTPG
jgi:hypothetical protein